MHFRAAGWSRDGVIEVIESDKYPFAVGVQWHPERMFNHGTNYAAVIQKFCRSV